MKILKQKDGTFKVESSKKGKFYIVDLDKQTCTCPHFLMRMRKIHGLCKHMEAVKDKTEKRDIDTYDIIVAYVGEKDEVDSLELIKKFGEEAVDDLLSRGELIEKNGMISVLD